MMKSRTFLLLKNVLKDKIVSSTLVIVLSAIIIGSIMSNAFYGLLMITSLSMGLVLSILALSSTGKVEELICKVRNLFFLAKYQIGNPSTQCDICKVKQCQRHNGNRENKNKLLIDAALDNAVESFFSKIISSFVQSWFVLLSHDNDFVQTLKQSLRQATTHLIEKICQIDGPQFITRKLFPILFHHIDTVELILQDGIIMDKIPSSFIIKDYPIHPAVCSRQAEKDYLRAVAKCLIKKIFHSENFDSKIFFSLVRELIACWILLPLMDVLSDPNLLNLLIVNILNKSPSKIYNNIYDNNIKVEFLKNFVDNFSDNNNYDKDPTVLTESKKLYCFMQYLKKHGVVDLLRFYLDVDNLNKELQDSKAITDPAKLSALYQESDKLLKDYEKIMNLNDVKSNSNVLTLTEAYEHVKTLLEGKWRKAFNRTPEYFKFIYGNREFEIVDDNKTEDQNWNNRIRSKFKGAFKGTIDGPSYEAIEVPTVWDALAEPTISSNPTIYNSVTQKLRRERGQNLDSFLLIFLQSLEQSTDVGEDVITISETQKKNKKLFSTNNNLVFGNLFSLDRVSKKFLVSSYISFSTVGPSKSALYLANKVLNLKAVFVKVLYSVISWSQKIFDIVLCQLISKLLSIGLYQPRLAVLIKLLEIQLFEEKHVEYTPAELLERQKQAKQCMETAFFGSGRLIHILQSPALNKHLMYCAFDSIITELYPELTS